MIGQSGNCLIIADCELQKSSEVFWEFTGSEKYNFDNQSLVLIKVDDEISIIELGCNEIVGSIRTDFFHKKLLSGKCYSNSSENRKILSYLMDTQTICLLDLQTKMNIDIIEHDTMISGLELDITSSKLLFKDSKKNLFLFDIMSKKKHILARNVSFWSWIPKSDVIVCHSGEKLLIWYSSDFLSNWQTIPLIGKVIRIASDEKETKIVSLDGNIEKITRLDSLLIRFNFVLKKKDFGSCLKILNEDESNSTTFHWKNVLEAALKEKNYFVVERCYAALGDYGKQTFFRKLNKMIRKKKPDWEIQKELALYNNQLSAAENILLEKEMREKAMEMYQEMHKWEDAINLGKETGQFVEMEEQYLEWLLSSGQNLKAGEILIKKKEYDKAIDLFLQQDLPGICAQIMMTNKVNKDLSCWNRLEREMENKKLFWTLGELLLYRNKRRQALNYFIKGNHFEKTINLARKEQPEILVGLHEKWGDWLRENQEYSSAIYHYIESKQVEKAIEVSIEMRDWIGAVKLVESLDLDTSMKYRKIIAEKLKERKHFKFAEKQYLKADLSNKAIEMWLENERFEDAERVCRENKISKSETEEIFCRHAEIMNEKKELNKAEKIYLSLGLYDKAIKMYKNKEQWKKMLELFAEFRPENLKDAHLLVGKKMETQKEYGEAEEHYLNAGDWKLAVQMYENIGRVFECLRLLSKFGTIQDTIERLNKYEEMEGMKGLENLLRQAHMEDVLIDFLCSNEKFNEAFELTENHRHKLEETHIKYGEWLAKNGKFEKAEEEFLKVNQPGVAIQILMRYEKFDRALALAEKQNQETAKAVYFKKGEYHLAQKNLKEMEESFIKANQAEKVVSIYVEEGMLDDALRIAKKFCRSKVKEVLEKIEIAKQNMNGEDMLRHAKILEENGSYSKVVDLYLVLGKQHFEDENILIQIWEKAVEICYNQDRERYFSVVMAVARKFESIKKFNLAGSYYENINKISDAVHCFLQSNQIERAHLIAEKETNQLERERLLNEIRECYRNQLENKEDAESLLKNNQIESGIEALVKQGEFERALIISKNKDKAAHIKIVKKILKDLTTKKNFEECLKLLSKADFELENYSSTYLKSLIDFAIQREDLEYLEYSFTLLQTIMLKNDLSHVHNNIRAEFEQLLIVTYLSKMKLFYKKKDEKRLLAKTNFSLLRYANLLPIDKCFYETGVSLRDIKEDKLAFFILNIYLDIYEAIEEGNDLEDLDHENLQLFDFPSLSNLILPETNLISENEKNEIRDWLLTISAKYGSDLVPEKKRCANCASSISKDCLNCPKCLSVLSQMCILTGNPIKNEHYECSSCEKYHDIENQNSFKLISLNCPWCNQIIS